MQTGADGRFTGTPQPITPTIEFNIYPNPSSGIFTIQGMEENIDAQVSIYDIQGKEIMAATLHNRTVDLQEQANGVYYIRVKASNGNLIHQQTLMVNH